MSAQTSGCLGSDRRPDPAKACHIHLTPTPKVPLFRGGGWIQPIPGPFVLTVFCSLSHVATQHWPVATAASEMQRFQLHAKHNWQSVTMTTTREGQNPGYKSLENRNVRRSSLFMNWLASFDHDMSCCAAQKNYL